MDTSATEAATVEREELHPAPFPTKRLSVRPRMWATDLPKGACALVGTSVDHNSAALVGVRTNVLTSRYYMEPCGGGKTRLTHISRVDCR